jgi:SAM-dependent methyltransferase
LQSTLPDNNEHNTDESVEKKSRIQDQLPRSTKYDRRWALSNSLGENVLYNAESLCKGLGLRRGMKVLDLGCGRAISSIFIAREFGCHVWAVDKDVPVRENLGRIRHAKLEKKVVPVQTDAWNLPFPKGFFDVILAVDSYMYYGTDPKFLPYIIQFLKPGGHIAVLDACFTREISHEAALPGFLRKTWRTIWRRVHSVRWWRRLWEKTGLVQIVRAETLENSGAILQEYVKDYRESDAEKPVVDVMRQDRKGFIKLFRLIAQRKLPKQDVT